MENIFPIEAYTKDETGYWRRLPLTSGLFFGILITVASPFSLIGTNLESSEIIRKILVSFIIGTIGFGLLYSLLFRLTALAMIRRAYRGIGRFATALPDENKYQFRLGCNWMKSKNFSVGGAIFLGDQDMIFVAHNANLPKDRVSFVIPYKPAPKLRVSDLELHGYKKILFARPPKLLCIDSESGRYEFLVPLADQARNRIEQIISTGA